MLPKASPVRSFWIRAKVMILTHRIFLLRWWTLAICRTSMCLANRRIDLRWLVGEVTGTPCGRRKTSWFGQEVAAVTGGAPGWLSMALLGLGMDFIPGGDSAAERS